MNPKETISEFIDNTIISPKDLEKLFALKNDNVFKIVKNFVELCKPSKVSVITDSLEDINYVKQKSISNQEESKLKILSVSLNDDPYSEFDSEKRILYIPAGTGGEFKVAFGF